MLRKLSFVNNCFLLCLLLAVRCDLHEEWPPKKKFVAVFSYEEIHMPITLTLKLFTKIYIQIQALIPKQGAQL